MIALSYISFDEKPLTGCPAVTLETTSVDKGREIRTYVPIMELPIREGESGEVNMSFREGDLLMESLGCF